MSTHCLSTFIQAAAQLHGHRGFKTDARPPEASGSKTSQNQSTTPPILNQTAQQNQGSTGLGRPNLQAQSRAGNPYTADTAAQNACSCGRDPHENFRRTISAPNSELKLTNPQPLNPITWPKPYAKPYNRQALQSSSPTNPNKSQNAGKSIQPKPAHFFHPSLTHKPRTSPIRTGAIDKNLRP